MTSRSIQKLAVTSLDSPNQARRLIETVNQIIATPIWIAPTLLNGWANHGAGSADAGFYRDPLGRVHFRGVIEDGTTAADTPLFVLPEGYRPLAILLMSGRASDTGQTISAGARLDIHTDGEVRLISGDVSGFGDGAYLSLDGISFLAEQ
jgi:hypothetical protein